VLSESIDLDCNYKDVYLIDNLNQVQKLDFANMKSDYENKYEVSTTVQGKLTYKIFTQDELADFLQDKENLNNLQQIKLLTKIDYQTIIRNEVLQ
jgi:hypothetical protein